MRLAPPSGRSRCPVRGGVGPGVVTLAWLRAAGRAGRGRRALPAGSPGALLMLGELPPADRDAFLRSLKALYEHRPEIMRG